MSTQTERIATEIFFVALIALVVLSILYGYSTIMLKHDFVIFTSEEQIETYVALPADLES